MRTARRGALAIALALLVLSAAGCSFESLQIRLSSFGQGQVDGIWLWRLQPTGSYARECRFQISDPYLQHGEEVVAYDQVCSDGVTGTRFEAQVQRQAGNPASVTLLLWFEPIASTSGTYRATAYNAAGESAMSSTIARL